MRLLVTDDDVDVIMTAQAMIRRGQEGVHIRRQVDAGHFRILVYHHVDKARILMGETIVVLTPDRGCDQQVDGGDARPPGDLLADGQPLGMLVVHGIDDVDEGLISREETMASAEHITLVPSF